MKKKLISLDPLKPPLYPLVNVLRKMADDEIKPYSEADIISLEKEVNKIIGIKDYSITAILFGVKDINVTPVVDFSIGHMDLPTKIVNNHQFLDLTGVPAYCNDFSQLRSPRVLYSIDNKLGINVNLHLILEKKLTNRPQHHSESDTSNIRFVTKLLVDYALQKDLIIRDLKYKSALLQNLLEHPRLVKIHFDEMPFPSPGFAFTIPDSTPDRFTQEVENAGFEIGVVRNKNGNAHYVIANFINHSKEQIERFIDQMDHILTKVLF